MEKLFSGYKFSVVEINDDDVDSVIVKLHEDITDSRGYTIRTEFIGYKIVNKNHDYYDAALDIYYGLRGDDNENS